MVFNRSIQELTLWEEMVSTVHRLSAAHEEEAQLCDDVLSVAATRNQLDSDSSAAGVQTSHKVSTRNCRLRSTSLLSAAQNLSNQSLDDVYGQGKVVCEANEFKDPDKTKFEPLASSVRYPSDEQENVFSISVSKSVRTGGIGSSRSLITKNNHMDADTDTAIEIPVRDSAHDPYEFVASQHTPKICQEKGKRHRRSLEYRMFDDPDERANSLLNTGVATKNSRPTIIRAKRKWKSDGTEKSEICADGVPDEVCENVSDSVDVQEQHRIANALSDAENYDLVFSQSLYCKSGAKTKLSEVECLKNVDSVIGESERTQVAAQNNDSNKENSCQSVQTASAMNESTFMEDTECYEFESVNDHNCKKIELHAIVASDTDIGTQTKTCFYNDLHCSESQSGRTNGKRLSEAGVESTKNANTCDVSMILIIHIWYLLDKNMSVCAIFTKLFVNIYNLKRCFSANICKDLFQNSASSYGT